MSEHILRGSLPPSNAAETPPAGHHPGGHKTFILHIFPTQSYKHKTMIRYSPLHGPWPDDKPSSFVTSALRVIVPKDMAAKGLWDWETGGQAEKAAPRTPDKIDHIQERMQRRENRTRSKGLLGLQPTSGRLEDISSGKPRGDER